MKKILWEAGLLILGVLLPWMLLSQIDFLKIFRIEENMEKGMDKIGEVILEYYGGSGEMEIHDPEILSVVDSIVHRICEENQISPGNVEIHLVSNTEVNAFALPGGHLIFHSGLILECKSPAEFSGVVAHEIAHIELGHLRQKLVREMGLLAVLAAVYGQGGSEMILEAARTLSSRAFDREMERAADRQAVEYLQEAEIPSSPFADFLLRMSEETEEMPSILGWVSTHPDPRERSRILKELIGEGGSPSMPIITDESWQKVQLHMQTLSPAWD